MRKPPFRTVRCIIRQRDKFLLVVHRGGRKGNPKWALPGGRVEPSETLEETARREIREELGIIVGALHEVGDYRYKGRFHKVLATEYWEPLIQFDRGELLKIGWHTLDQVSALAAQGRLHTGFEDAAIRSFAARLSIARNSR